MTTTNEPSFHPVANTFPLMGEAGLGELAADIRAHGQREPVWLHRDGRIIDGRNRWLACRRADLEPRTRTFEGEDAQLVPFVVSLNLHRRHLSESQRAMVAARIANLDEGRPGKTTAIAAVSQSQAAYMLNVSVDSLQRAKKVIVTGTPEIIAAVERGELAASAAAKMLQPDEKRTLKTVYNMVKHEDRAAKRAAREQAVASAPPNPILSGERYRLHHRDFRELAAEMLDASVDCIITDPPYPKGDRHLLADLGKAASRVLKPGGRCLVMVDNFMMYEARDLMLPFLGEPRMAVAYFTPGFRRHASISRCTATGSQCWPTSARPAGGASSETQ
jgi:ParB-like chromosome segregation protein Spo0J